MTEPLKLYNIDGEEVVMYSPNVIKEMVGRRLLFFEPPEDVDIFLGSDEEEE